MREATGLAGGGATALAVTLATTGAAAGAALGSGVDGAECALEAVVAAVAFALVAVGTTLAVAATTGGAVAELAVLGEGTMALVEGSGVALAEDGRAS